MKDSHSVHLDQTVSVEKVLKRLPKEVDYVFHLAGNALVGEALPTGEKLKFHMTDFVGPVTLLSGLTRRIRTGGGMGVVTSIVAALDRVGPIGDYQETKQAMVEWWADNQHMFHGQDIGFTLIAMEVINTEVWDRIPGFSRLTRRVINFTVPGPKRYAPASSGTWLVTVRFPTLGCWRHLPPSWKGSSSPTPW